MYKVNGESSSCDITCSAEFHPERATCIITSLKWIIQICSNFYFWVSKIVSTHPIHTVVWGNFPFNASLAAKNSTELQTAKDGTTVLQRSNYGYRKTAVKQSGHIRQFLINGSTFRERHGFTRGSVREKEGRVSRKPQTERRILSGQTIHTLSCGSPLFCVCVCVCVCVLPRINGLSLTPYYGRFVPSQFSAHRSQKSSEI